MADTFDTDQSFHDLQLKRAILASLRADEFGPQDNGEAIRNLEHEIWTLERENRNRIIGMGEIDMRTQHGSSASSSSMSTPLSSGSGGDASHRITGPSRKRSFGSSHLDVDRFNRSKRATPTPMVAPNRPVSPSALTFGSSGQSSPSSGSVIDLTTDEHEWLRPQEGRPTPRAMNGPQANNLGMILNQVDASSPAAMTLPRRPYAPQSQPSHGGELGTRRYFSDNQARTTHHNQPAPQHPIQHHHVQQANAQQVQGLYGNRPAPSPKQYRMPGAYVDSDSDGEQWAPRSLSNGRGYHPLANPSTRAYGLNPAGTSYNHQSLSPARGLQPTPPVIPQIGSSAFGLDDNFRQLPPLDFTVRPDQFRNPRNSPAWQRRHRNSALSSNQVPALDYSSVAGLYAPRPAQLSPDSLHLPEPRSMSLAAITQRANNIDFSAVLDAQGYPLHPRLANFLEDDAPHDPDREKKEIVDLLSNIQSDADALEAEMAATPGGMRCPLYDHQKIALNWMTKMETGTNKGGILGDDMGLGKTITTLALMLSRQSPTAVKTNLIIGPVALIKQWEQEIQKKLSPTHKLSVLLLHQKRKVAYSEIKRYDVALTTYGSIAAEWRAYEKHIEQRKASALYTEEADAELAKKCPLLHPRSKFYRIILDEAQCIKNKDTQGAKGVHKIDATYHWCLTGTPIMNNVTELYSLFRFLRIKPYCDFKLFQRAFKSLGPRNTSTDYTRSQAMEQLRVILQATMLRRMKDSKINGKPLLTLPPKTQHSELVQFSEEERQFYMDLETRSQVVLNRYLRANTVGKNYSNILVLLLRLRQACCHPHLTEFETVVPAEDDGSSLILAKGMDEDVVKRIKEKSLECPICWDAVDDPTILLPCGHFVCTECYSSLGDRVARQNISEGNEASGIRCPECRGNSTKSIKYNVFLNAHMPEKLGAGEEELADISDRENSDDEEDDRDSDNESVGSLADFVVDDNADELDDDDDARLDAELSAAVKLKKEKDSQSTKKVRKKTAKSKKGRKPKSKDKGKSKDEPIHPSQLKSLRDEASKNIAARRRYMKYLEDNWEDSAKVTKVIELLKEIQITDEKTIIFSQWTSLLDLVECQVKSKIPDVEYCRYTGKMSRAQRDEAVADFVENPKNRIMLVSLRAGNAGLNLTVASRVIICDPFWNPFIENQAVDRAHRIGQQREVQIHRILIQGTVEDRILTLQEQKRELVDSALGDGKDGQNARLNNAELRYLFGVGNLPGRL